ncbi:MAG TPA: PEP/pyruvate-binding domain-containing protein [Patescibacteria group bacterium]|nr:PEP/pyruvate-binding domain-containing protein [Patescibacteria group bacterium]
MAAQNYVTSLGKLENDESHGEKVNQLIKLKAAGFLIPDSFIVKAEAYLDFLKANNIEKKIKHLLGTVDLEKAKSVKDTAFYIKRHLEESSIPNQILNEILREYKNLGGVLHHAHINVSFSHVSKGIPSHSLKGDASLINIIKEKWLSIYSPTTPTVNPTLIVQKIVKGKTGTIRTSTKSINTKFLLSKKETEYLENLVSKFKKEFYMPHEIDWAIDGNKTYVLKIKPETHIDSHKTFFPETHFSIIKNSHHII